MSKSVVTRADRPPAAAVCSPRVSVVVEQRVAVDAPPAAGFAYLHEPRSRGAWDAMVDFCRLEAERPARGVRLHLHGRRTAPSWVGEYAEYAPPRRSVVRLVEGVGMPFRHFHQILEVTPRGSRSELEMR